MNLLEGLPVDKELFSGVYVEKYFKIFILNFIQKKNWFLFLPIFFKLLLKYNSNMNYNVKVLNSNHQIIQIINVYQMELVYNIIIHTWIINPNVLNSN